METNILICIGDYTILTDWSCLHRHPYLLPFSSGWQCRLPQYSSRSAPLFLFNKELQRRWRCSVVSKWPCRMGACFLILCYCENRVLMSQRIPQICRGTRPSVPSLLFPSIRLCSGTSHRQCPARTTGASSHCLEVSWTFFDAVPTSTSQRSHFHILHSLGGADLVSTVNL